MAQASLKLAVILLSERTKYWAYRHTPLARILNFNFTILSLINVNIQLNLALG